MKKETINVYWTAWSAPEEQTSMLLFNSPKKLFKELIKNKTINSKNQTLFSCPAVKDLTKNLYSVSSPISSKFKYEYNNIVSLNENNLIDLIGDTHPNVSNFGPMLVYQAYYIFFAEEPLIARFTNPYFSKTEGYRSTIPGEFDIGKWFRPYPLQYQMWNNSGIFEIKENEDLFYVEFMTDKNINLIRFDYDEEVQNYADQAIMARKIFPSSTLNSLYLRFKNSGIRESLIAKIKKNIKP